MSMFKLETDDEFSGVARKLRDETTTCTCDDDPHQNKLHDLANDLPDFLDKRRELVIATSSVEVLAHRLIQVGPVTRENSVETVRLLLRSMGIKESGDE